MPLIELNVMCCRLKKGSSNSLGLSEEFVTWDGMRHLMPGCAGRMVSVTE